MDQVFFPPHDCFAYILTRCYLCPCLIQLDIVFSRVMYVCSVMADLDSSSNREEGLGCLKGVCLSALLT